MLQTADLTIRLNAADDVVIARVGIPEGTTLVKEGNVRVTAKIPAGHKVAVRAIKAGRQPELDRPLDHGTEIDVQIPALLPADYLPDVHTRLVMYKRIASAADEEDLRELQVEMIDRFGLLPEPARSLFTITGIKLKATPMGIRKIEAGPQGGRLLFEEQANIDPARLIHLIRSRPKEFRLDGPTTLKLVAAMPAPEDRLGRVEEVLDRLGGADARG